MMNIAAEQSVLVGHMHMGACTYSDLTQLKCCTISCMRKSRPRSRRYLIVEILDTYTQYTNLNSTTSIECLH